MDKQFKAYLQAIWNNLTHEAKNNLKNNSEELNNAYKEFKATWSINNSYFLKDNNTKQKNNISNNTSKYKAEEDRKAKELAKAEEARKLAEYNLKNKQNWPTDVQDAQTKVQSSWNVDIWNWWFSNAMDTSKHTFNELNEKTAEQKNINEMESARKEQETLKGILDPIMDWYKNNTTEFTKLLDEAMEQNKISIANQRKIADSMRETAWVASLIAWSKVWPWMSESQINSIAKDISVWYQDAINKAEWNYELARVNWWNNLKALWMDSKSAKDALMLVSEKLWLQVAEPYLLALASNKKNINEVYDKLNELQTWTQKKMYEDAESKQLTKIANEQRAIEWEKWTDQERQAQLINAFPKDANGNQIINLTKEQIDWLVKNRNLDWNSVYSNLQWYNGLAETDRNNVYAMLSAWKMWWDQAKKIVRESSKVNTTGMSNKKWDTTTTTWTLNKDVDMSTVSEISDLNNTPNVKTEQQALDKANKDIEYTKKINSLSKIQLDKLKKIAALSEDKRNKVIEEIKASWSPNTDLYLEFIDKNKPLYKNSWLKNTSDLLWLLKQKNYWNLSIEWNIVKWIDQDWKKASWEIQNWQAVKKFI